MRKRKSWLRWLDASPGGIPPGVDINDSYVMYEAKKLDGANHRKIAIFVATSLPILIPVIPLAAAILVIAVVGAILLSPLALMFWFLFMREDEVYTRPWRPKK